MRRVTKAWPTRLLAAVTALALVVACVVGAYAHAAGHASPAAEHAAAAADTDDHAEHHRGQLSETATSNPGHVGHAHDCGGTDQTPFDCCDTICHGGQAILATAVLVPHPALSAPLIQSASAFGSAEPDGLDRPPKPFRPA
jgi:hypothetical protein